MCVTASGRSVIAAALIVTTPDWEAENIQYDEPVTLVTMIFIPVFYTEGIASEKLLAKSLTTIAAPTNAESSCITAEPVLGLLPRCD